MLPTCSLSRPTLRISRRRVRRIMEGISLWLAVLLFLFVHPLYAEASEGAGLGIEHQLITPYTSFLAVDKTPSRPMKAAMDSDRVPTLLPAGSTSGMLRYPQTATIAPLLQMLGLLGLMLSAAIGLLKGRAFV